MAKHTLPKKIYVKRVVERGEEYMCAETDIENLAEMGESVVVGVYELQSIMTAVNKTELVK